MTTYEYIIQQVLESLAELQESHEPESEAYRAYEDMQQAIGEMCREERT